MAYCRWSSDHGECDVYVYEDVSGGWTTHVAGRKSKHIMPDEIKALFPSDPRAADWVDRQMAAMKAAEQWRESLPSDEVPCTYMRPDRSTYEGTTKFLKDSEYMDLSEIGEEAGESFNDPTPGECAERLEALRAKGFRVPQYAIDSLRQEALLADPAKEG